MLDVEEENFVGIGTKFSYVVGDDVAVYPVFYILRTKLYVSIHPSDIFHILEYRSPVFFYFRIL